MKTYGPYDVCFRKPVDKGDLRETFWPKVGVAFVEEKEDGVQHVVVKLDSAPINWDGKLYIFMKGGRFEK